MTVRFTIFEVCRAFRSVFRSVMGERMIVRVLRIGSDFVSRYDATKSIRVAPSRRCAKQRIEGRQDFRIDRIFFDEQILKILSILKSCLKSHRKNLVKK